MLNKAKEVDYLAIGKKYLADIEKGKSMSEIDGLIRKGMIEGMILVSVTYTVDAFAKEVIQKKTSWYVS